jgi:hypothetical protein
VSWFAHGGSESGGGAASSSSSSGAAVFRRSRYQNESRAAGEGGLVGLLLDVLAHGRHVEPGAGLHSQLLWHAHAAGERAMVDQVMARIDEALDEDPDYLDRQSYTLENLADFAVARGQHERAIGYLERLKAADHERFAKTHRSEDLKPLWDDPAFEALHGKRKKKG